MLDINYIKENIEKVKKAALDKHTEVHLDELLKQDTKRRELILKVDELRQKRNEISAAKNIEEGRKIKGELEILEQDLAKTQQDYDNLMLEIPNVPVEGVPEGGEEDYEVLKTEGEATKFDFTPKDHLAIGEALDLIDVTRATKVSGPRFAYLKNEGAMLELALVQYAMSTLREHGFSPIMPPVLIKQEMTKGLGYWHAGGNENYYLVTDYEISGENDKKQNNLYLVGTAEHALVPMHANETLSLADLPKKYAGFSPAFRREAGSYGKDTRGILRVHQFDKVEMVQFVKPEEDEKMRREMLTIVEGMLKQLQLPYRVIKLASGDISFPAAETVDIETWIPSQNKYRETHSISTTTDFQARRLNIKYKQEDGKTGFVHILNGTAFAIGRMIIAILENFQQADGSVKIPEVLQKYTGFSVISK